MILKGLHARDHHFKEAAEVVLSDAADRHQLDDTIDCHLEVIVVLRIELFEYHLDYGCVLREKILEDFRWESEADPSQEGVHQSILKESHLARISSLVGQQGRDVESPLVEDGLENVGAGVRVEEVVV